MIRFRAHLLPAADLTFVATDGDAVSLPLGSRLQELFRGLVAAFEARAGTLIPVLLGHDEARGAYGHVARLDLEEDGIYAVIDLGAAGVGLVMGADGGGKFCYVSGGFSFVLDDLSSSSLTELSLTPVPQFNSGQRPIVVEMTERANATLDTTSARLYVAMDSQSVEAIVTEEQFAALMGALDEIKAYMVPAEPVEAVEAMDEEAEEVDASAAAVAELAEVKAQLATANARLANAARVSVAASAPVVAAHRPAVPVAGATRMERFAHAFAHNLSTEEI